MTNITPSPERLGEALFVLSDRLRASGVLSASDQVHEAYERVVAEFKALSEATHLEEVVRLRPIETAPRDGTPVFVQFRSDIYPDLRPQREDLEAWNGVSAVMRNRGDISDWCFAAPVGHGGFPDEWLVGWAPVSIAKGVAALTLFEVRR
jgi:hypothetical protein